MFPLLASLHFIPSVEEGQQTKADKLAAEKYHQLCMTVPSSENT